MKLKLKYKRRWAFYGLIVVSLTWLILFVRKYPVSAFDYYITKELQQLKRGDFESLMAFISMFGNSATMPLSVIFASLLFYWANLRREARFVLVTLVTDALTVLVKFLVNRPRPTVKDAMIMLKFDHAAFPSGHVVHYVVFFGFLLTVMIVSKKIPHFWRIFVGAWCTFLILTVSVSRIYLGAHWATDVLGAYLFGMFYLGLLLTFYLKIPEKIAENLPPEVAAKIPEAIVEKLPEKVAEKITEKKEVQ